MEKVETLAVIDIENRAAFKGDDSEGKVVWNFKTMAAATFLCTLYTGAQIILYFVGGSLSFISQDLGATSTAVWLPVAYTLVFAATAPGPGRNRIRGSDPDLELELPARCLESGMHFPSQPLASRTGYQHRGKPRASSSGIDCSFVGRDLQGFSRFRGGICNWRELVYRCGSSRACVYICFSTRTRETIDNWLSRSYSIQHYNSEFDSTVWEREDGKDGGGFGRCQSLRERILKTKALELEEMKRVGEIADRNRFATLSQRSSEARNWQESDECDTDNVIEVMAETSDAPRRPDRTRLRPGVPTRAAAGGNTRTRKGESDALSIIFSMIEES
ncbi:uncharacterized protein LY89DRAFT_720466 [Mollisia scopiformis]|uniref:Uncharacterized protein n=1 Tax=Mollisia scopiformis TaxID=149040 RepID=A0A194X5H7_MOLSC|nr:uncharacterized protein LY89DRAFT_720466 [Mollisia scopiformis]KUJ15067.1 hypothetical protein LY89DRAFT_720466 [Mollisia scopiformis]